MVHECGWTICFQEDFLTLTKDALTIELNKNTEFLQTVPLFKDLPRHLVATLCQLMKSVSFNRFSKIVSHGEKVREPSSARGRCSGTAAPDVKQITV